MLFRTLKYIIFVLLFTVIVGCNFFKTEEEEPIARVNDTYLYKSDVEVILPDGLTKQDSLMFVKTYINNWAKKALLMDGAIVNIAEEKQQEFNKLISQYKNDLYTKAYIEALVKKNIDTTITYEELEHYYSSNQTSFKLNDDLLKFRYISLPLNPVNKDTIVNRFKRFTQKDKTYLDSISLQFSTYSLNDSLWVKYNNVKNKLPIVTTLAKEQLLKKTNFVQLKDSINLYLMHINDVRFRNEYAPLGYVKNTIEKIVINKRKLNLINDLEKDIIKNAIKKNQFEIYE